MEISLEETQGSVSLASDRPDMLLPTGVLGNIYTQIGAT